MAARNGIRHGRRNGLPRGTETERIRVAVRFPITRGCEHRNACARQGTRNGTRLRVVANQRHTVSVLSVK
jgi:hypothetical protein